MATCVCGASVTKLHGATGKCEKCTIEELERMRQRDMEDNFYELEIN